MMRCDVLATGAAVLAAAPVVVSPFSASAADALTFDQWLSLTDYNYDNPIVANYFDVNPIWRFYFSATAALWEYVYIEGNTEIVPSEFKGYAGFYLKDGVRRFGSLYGDGVSRSITSTPVEGSFAPVALAALQDGTLSLELYPYPDTGVSSAAYNITKTVTFGNTPTLSVYYERSGGGRLRSNVLFPSNGIFERYTFSVTDAYSDAFYIYCDPSASPLEFTTTSDYIVRPPYSARVLLAGGGGFGQLPENTDYPIITKSNVVDYINDVLNPWTLEQAPDLEPYLWTAIEDDAPIYPTDFAEGIPKAWTVENPRLPSYSLDLQLPTADYETIDVATPIEQNANGIRFWWAMLGTLFDHFGLKSLVVLACALGLFLLILTRLGR